MSYSVSIGSLNTLIESSIVINPLVVSPETKVSEAIAKMSNSRSYCNSNKETHHQLEYLYTEARSSCVVVIENTKVVNILTERDVLTLSLRQPQLSGLLVKEVMNSHVVTVQKSELKDFFVVINLLEKHSINHLPILDEQDKLIGIVTNESLRLLSQLFELMKLRPVSEVMSDRVFCAEPDISLLEIAEGMCEYKVSYVIIVESENQETFFLSSDVDSLIPLGIVTERDIVQCLALGLDLSSCPAAKIMSQPVCTVRPQDSLWLVHDLMERNSIAPVVVTGTEGYLLGIITQSHLLKALNPIEIYKIAEILQSKVVNLEAEKLSLQESRAGKLEKAANKLVNNLLSEVVEPKQVEDQLKVRKQKLLNLMRHTQSAAQLHNQDHIVPHINKKVKAFREKYQINQEPIQVLIIDDNPEDIEIIENLLTKTGNFGIVCYQQFKTALKNLDQNQPPDIILLNLWLPDSKDLDVLKAINTCAPDVPIVILAETDSQDIATVAVQQGAQDYLVKSQISQDSLVRSINYAIHRKQLLQQLQDLFDNARDLIHSVRVKDGKFEYVNRIFQETLSYSSAEISTLTIFEILDPVYYQTWLELLAEIEKGTTQFSRIELVFLSKYQEKIIVEGSINCYFDRKSEQIIRGIFRDITQKKQIESERQDLIQELTNFKDALDESAIVVTTDAQGKITYTNDKFCEISGYLPSELLGQTHRLVNSGHHPLSFFQNLWTTIQSGKIWKGEICNRSQKGSLYWVSSTIIPFLDKEGKPFKYLTIHFDITLQKQAQASLRQKNLLLKSVTQTQAQFITTQNHHNIFEGLLSTLLDLTDSEYGFIGEILLEDDRSTTIEDKSLKIRAISCLKTDALDICSDRATLKLSTENCEKNIEFDNINTLFEAVIKTGKPVIANNLQTNLRWDGTSDDRPPLNSFLGLPFFNASTLVGVVGIANRPEGYNNSIVEYLNPVLVTCSNLIEGYRLARQKQQAEAQIAKQLASIEAAVDGIAIIENGCYQYVNPAYVKIFGYESSAKLVGKSWRMMYSAEELEKFDRDILPVLEQEHSWQGEVTAICQNGNFFTQQLSLTLLENNLIISVCQDVTDRKKAELELQRYSSQVEDLYNNAPCGYHSLDAAGTYVQINDRELKWLGYSREEVLYKKKFTDFLTPESQQVFLENFKLLKENNEIDNVEYQIIKRNGSIRWFSINATAVKDSQGNFLMTRSTMFDITETKVAEAKLQQTNAELARATRLKDEFLANMSHELRTPLNAILGMTETLQEQVYGDLNERQQDALKTICKSGNHLLQLINDILDLAKIESEQVKLDLAPTRIPRLCQDSIIFIKQQAVKKRIQVTMEVYPEVPDLNIDERRIRQVLINLLNNAVKFTPEEGSITLKVTIEAAENHRLNDRSNQKNVRFSVIDTGIGISQKNLPILFQPFVQIDSALNRQYSGTGLGLSLVKKIVELHGGKVGVNSQEGVGSHFWFDLPFDDLQLQCYLDPNLSSDSLDPLPVNPDRPISSYQILLAEDNLANIKTISGYLKAKGYKIIVAQDGQEAIELAKSHHPDLILMDIQMPKLDGLKAMKQICQDAALKDIPIIAMTALAMDGDRQKCLAAGATDYVSKPLRLKQLTSMIQKIVVQELGTP